MISLVERYIRIYRRYFCYNVGSAACLRESSEVQHVKIADTGKEDKKA